LAQSDSPFPNSTEPHNPFVTPYVPVQKNTPSAIVVTQVIQEIYEELEPENAHPSLASFVAKFHGLSFAGTGLVLNGQSISENSIYLEAQQTLRNIARKFKQLSPDEPKCLCIIIDEMDKMADFNNVASFWKTLQEKLAADDCRNLMVAFIGMPEVKNYLNEDHESFLRTFTSMTLDKMSDDEATQIVKRTIAVGRPAKTISPKALERILFYSENYPHLIQEIGYSAYEIAQADQIEEADVEAGIHGTAFYPGSIKRLGELFFTKMYDEIKKSENYRETLRLIAENSGLSHQWVNRQTLLEQFSKKKSSLDAILQQLLNKELIQRNPDKSGEYRLVSKMFQVYIDKILGNSGAKGEL
jgi:hypothetical protein